MRIMSEWVMIKKRFEHQDVNENGEDKYMN